MTELNLELIPTVIMVIFGFSFLFSGMYLGATMGLFGFLGLVYIRGLNHALGELMTVPYTIFSNYDLSVIPLFILMGQLCFYAGMSADLFETTYKRKALRGFSQGLFLMQLDQVGVFLADWEVSMAISTRRHCGQ